MCFVSPADILSLKWEEDRQVTWFIKSEVIISQTTDQYVSWSPYPEVKVLWLFGITLFRKKSTGAMIWGDLSPPALGLALCPLSSSTISPLNLRRRAQQTGTGPLKVAPGPIPSFSSASCSRCGKEPPNPRAPLHRINSQALRREIWGHELKWIFPFQGYWHKGQHKARSCCWCPDGEGAHLISHRKPMLGAADRHGLRKLSESQRGQTSQDYIVRPILK